MARPTMINEDNGVQTVFWSCPVKFIPDSVWSFLRCKVFYEKHPSAPFPAIDKVSPRYVMAEMVFDNETARYLAERV